MARKTQLEQYASVAAFLDATADRDAAFLRLGLSRAGSGYSTGILHGNVGTRDGRSLGNLRWQIRSTGALGDKATVDLVGLVVGTYLEPFPVDGRRDPGQLSLID